MKRKEALTAVVCLLTNNWCRSILNAVLTDLSLNAENSCPYSRGKSWFFPPQLFSHACKQTGAETRFHRRTVGCTKTKIYCCCVGLMQVGAESSVMLEVLSSCGKQTQSHCFIFFWFFSRVQEEWVCTTLPSLHFDFLIYFFILKTPTGRAIAVLWERHYDKLCLGFRCKTFQSQLSLWHVNTWHLDVDTFFMWHFLQTNLHFIGFFFFFTAISEDYWVYRQEVRRRWSCRQNFDKAVTFVYCVVIIEYPWSSRGWWWLNMTIFHEIIGYVAPIMHLWAWI